MARGGEQPAEVTEEVVLADEDLGTGSIKHTSTRDLLQGGVTGGSYFRVGGVGDESLYGTGPGRVPS